MAAGDLVAFNLILLAAIAAPGPALIHALRTTLAEGRVAGLQAGAGLGLVAAMWTGLACLGLERLFALVPWAYLVLKVLGALYLLRIAAATWRQAGDPVAPPGPGRGRRAFLRGAAINLANPKSVLFAASVLVVVFPPDLGAAEIALVAANHLAVEIAFYAAVATLLSRPAARAAYLGAKRGLDRIAACVMGALGLRLLLDRP